MADIRNTIGDNQKSIERILNNLLLYYRDRAPADQAALLLFALDQAINENPMGYSDAAIAGLRAHRDMIQNNRKNRTEEEVLKIKQLHERLCEAQNACDVIANGDFQSRPEFQRAGAILAAWREEWDQSLDPETRTAALANPAQWILGTSIDTKTLAAFFQVMGNLGSQNTLSEDVQTAFQTLRTFSNDVLSLWAANAPFNSDNKFSLQDEIASNQSTFSMMASAALLEERIRGLEGLQETVQRSAPDDSEGQQRLIDYIVALSNQQLKSDASDEQNLVMPIRALQAKLLEMLRGKVGSLVLLDKSRADESLSPLAKEALVRVYNEIFDHYKEEPWFPLRLQSLRAQEAAPTLKAVLGLAGLSSLLKILDNAEIGAYHQRRDDVETWLLNHSPDAAKVMFLAPMYGGILQDLIQKDSNTPVAQNAQTVLTYIQGYFNAGGKSSEFKDMTTKYVKPILDFAKTQGQEEAFLRALTDVVEVGAFYRKINFILVHDQWMDEEAKAIFQTSIPNFISFRYTIDGKSDLLNAATQNDDSQSPRVSATILQDNCALKGIKDLLPRIEANPETALWDTARWLGALRRQREYEYSDVHQNPQVHRAAERIEAYIKRKFLETPWWLKLDSLVKDMHKAEKASHSFYADGLLYDLCRDDVDTKALDPAEYASLILKMQWAKDHDDLDHDDPDGANKQSDARALLPFLSKAMERFPGFRSRVDREKSQIQEFIAASAKVSFSNHPEFQSPAYLIYARTDVWEITKYAVLIDSVMADIDAGIISATPEQRQDAATFQQKVDQLIRDKNYTLDEVSQRLYKQKLALKAIVDADLPEFKEIQSVLASIRNCEDLWGNTDINQKVSNFPEKVSFATNRALLRQSELPSRVADHLQVLQQGIGAYLDDFLQNDQDTDYASRQCKKFTTVVQTLGAQQDILEASQNPNALEGATTYSISSF